LLFLYRAGLDRKPRLLQLQRQEAALRGAIGETEGQIAQAQQQIGETRLRILDLGNARRDSAAQELREVQTRLADVESRGDAARDVLDRREVTAPVTGTVVNLKVFTAGGVVAPGAVLMEIVPADDRLVIEARVKPTDIDVVHAGLGAQVRLSAYKQRTTPVLDGQVTRVSADRLVDERTAQDYYTARIEVDRAELARLPEVHLSAGMPVEVMVITGERTLLNYLLRPLKDSFARAFREE
ncbi:MAG: HlyD family type I secretion periplasmic adaptor subunit, partial [Rhodospirillales bacterium]|nr:HlyD family type I secretion periplasmic adaptor subunit [Rhodospirillales bacterium]